METAAGFAKLLLLNGATMAAAVGLASRLRLDSRSERLLATGVLAVGIANLTALALGLAGHLRFWPLLAAQLPFALAAALWGRWSIARDFLDPRPVLRLASGSAERLAAGLLVIPYAYALFLGCVGESSAGDALMYHLPLMAEYAREGRIAIPELGRYWGNEFWAYYPGGAYLLYQWFILPFGSSALADLVQFPYAFGTALACWVLARVLGARRRDAIWAAILFLAVPIVMNQVKTAMVDVTLTFLFAAGLAFLLVRPLTPARLLLGAIAWGAAPAVKLPAAIYVGLGAVCIAAHQLQRGTARRDALRALALTAASLALGFAALSGYWFARNWWLAGSAAYPLNLQPGPPTAWTNVIFYGVLFPLLDFAPVAPEVFNYETGAGPQFMCLAVPALFALAAAEARARRPALAAIAMLPIVAYAVWLLRLSTSVQTLLRYVVPAMPIGFAAFSWLLPRASRRSWLVALALFSVVFSVGVGTPRIGSYTNVESLRLGLAKWRRGEADGRFDVMGALDIQDYRRAWAYVADLPEPHHIAASHLIFTYPMQGRDFRHRVHHVRELDRQKWLDELRRRHVDLLALAEMVDTRGTLELGHGVRLSLDFIPSANDYVHASRRVAGRNVRALRLRYMATGSENASFFVGVDGFARTWEIPLPAGEEERVEVVPWEGEVASVQVMLAQTPRTRLRGEIAVSIASLEVQETDGRWTEIADGRDWEVLRWPVEYYWAEQFPDRFELVMRDRDRWQSSVSGEARIYRVRNKGGHATAE